MVTMYQNTTFPPYLQLPCEAPKERPMAAVSPRAENERKIQTEEAKANHHTSKSVNMLDSLKFSWCLSLSLRIKSAWEERFPPPQRHSLGPGSLVQSPQWEQETESKRETVYLKCRLPPNPRVFPPCLSLAHLQLGSWPPPLPF